MRITVPSQQASITTVRTSVHSTYEEKEGEEYHYYLKRLSFSLLTRTCEMRDYFPEALTINLPLLLGRTIVQMCMDNC